MNRRTLEGIFKEMGYEKGSRSQSDYSLILEDYETIMDLDINGSSSMSQGYYDGIAYDFVFGF